MIVWFKYKYELHCVIQLPISIILNDFLKWFCSRMILSIWITLSDSCIWIAHLFRIEVKIYPCKSSNSETFTSITMKRVLGLEEKGVSTYSFTPMCSVRGRQSIKLSITTMFRNIEKTKISDRLAADGTTSSGPQSPRHLSTCTGRKTGDTSLLCLRSGQRYEKKYSANESNRLAN